MGEKTLTAPLGLFRCFLARVMVFPYGAAFGCGREKSIKALEEAMIQERRFSGDPTGCPDR